jgi:NADH dehydrogenase
MKITGPSRTARIFEAVARRRVVVVGGGFAGLAAAHALGDRHEVTRIDRRPAFEFLPNLHEIVSGRKTPGMVRLPQERLARQEGQRWLEDEVVALDLERRRVHTRGSGEVAWDALILAPGLESTAGRVPGAREHAVGMRTAADAARVRDALARLAATPGRSHVTIVGGGLTGIEVLGEVLREHRRTHLRVRLVDGAARLGGGWPQALHRRVRKLARAHDVEVLLATRVAEVRPDAVALADGRTLASDLTVWTGSGALPAFVERAHLRRGPRGGLACDDALRCVGRPDVFVAGDLADAPSRPRRQATEALRMGRRAGKNALRQLAGASPKAFARRKGPALVTFGDLSAFLVLPDRTVVESEALSVGRELVFQRTMAQLDRGGGKSAERAARRVVRSATELDWFSPEFPLELAARALDLRVFDRG